MKPIQKFDFVAKVGVIRSEKPTVGLTATPAPNPHQGNRVTGFLPDGTEVIVAQRPNGKGGMDFNKLLGGKVFAVAADGMSPVREKSAESGDEPQGSRQASNEPPPQKQENGKPLFSCSGFYLLSSKEYPALDIFTAYTHLVFGGQLVLTLRKEQFQSPRSLDMLTTFDLEDFEAAVGEQLSDANCAVSRFDPDANKRRDKGIKVAQLHADDDAPYKGVEFRPLHASARDGKPFILIKVMGGDKDLQYLVCRQVEEKSPGKESRLVALTPEDALARMRASKFYATVRQQLETGAALHVVMLAGTTYRTSVSFRRKVENIQTGAANSTYGDGPYIVAATEGWCKGIVTVMHSLHPNFPSADYESHYYVAAPRQAELGFTRLPNKAMAPPQVPTYNLSEFMANLGAQALA